MLCLKCASSQEEMQLEAHLGGTLDERPYPAPMLQVTDNTDGAFVSVKENSEKAV